MSLSKSEPQNGVQSTESKDDDKIGEQVMSMKLNDDRVMSANGPGASADGATTRSEAKDSATMTLPEQKAGAAESEHGNDRHDKKHDISTAAAFTRSGPVLIDFVVLKFTTLSDGNEKASFVVTRQGGDIGRAEKNAVCVPSDTTLIPDCHAVLNWVGDQFFLEDRSPQFHAAVRVGTGHAADRWPLKLEVVFSAGNSIFRVQSVGTPQQPSLVLQVESGPRKGETLNIDRGGATLGRANDNTVCISDRELSRKHSRISYDADVFYVSDMRSTNGTYVQLVGPYAGRYPINLNDHILVGRTGFSINRYDYGISEETGFRRTMEDKCIMVQNLVVPGLGESPLCPQTWMGVYDGHGGPEASQYLHVELHKMVARKLAESGARLADAHAGEERDAIVKSAMTDAFLATDEQFIKESETCQAGSTATTALILGNRLYCGNVGDSRTVLCRKGQAIAMSTDHKPSREDESVRIKAAGGFVINKRVMGELAVSRAFGDAEFKKGISEILGDEAASMKDDSIEQDLSKPLVIAEPEFVVEELSADDEFVLLACDGLFDVMTNQEACDLVHSEMSRHGDVQLAAEALSRTAIDQLGSRDNVTILLVLLQPTWGK